MSQRNPFEKVSVRSQFIVTAMLLALATISLFTIDYPLSQYATSHKFPDEIYRALRTMEPFGSPYGMTFVLLTILVVTTDRVTEVVRLGAIAIAGGLSAAFMKVLISRARPDHFDFTHHQILDSFQGFLPMMKGGGAVQSFPSAHTAMAVAFAVALANRFPRSRWLWYSFAAMVGMQRVADAQHFASDVFAGAAFGWTIAQFVLMLWQQSHYEDLSTEPAERMSPSLQYN
ncbi:MAG: phosphatase PAP2 family protein [Planctomycetaceae bacterium]|nr:phosphatase PAP2 family protein [Planctomycetaceae bacterium]